MYNCAGQFLEAVSRRCSVKKVCLRCATLLKKCFWQRCFPVNFEKILRTPFFLEHLRWKEYEDLHTAEADLHYNKFTLFMAEVYSEHSLRWRCIRYLRRSFLQKFLLLAVNCFHKKFHLNYLPEF